MARFLHAGTALVHSGDTKRPFNLLEISIKAYYEPGKLQIEIRSTFAFFFPSSEGDHPGEESQWISEVPLPALTCGLLLAPTAQFKLRLETQIHPGLVFPG